MLNSPHRDSPFPSCSSLLTLLPWILQSDIWELTVGYGEKKISSDKNWKEAFWETALRCVNAPHGVTLFSDQFADTVFLKFAMRYFSALCSLRWQRKYPQIRNETSFLGNSFQIRDFSSQSYITASWSRFLAPFLWIPRTGISDGFDEYRETGNLLREKPEGSFLRNCFVTCEFTSKG